MSESVVQAPVNLDANSRIGFRDAALGALERLGTSAGGKLVIDLSSTLRVDSAGLGTLVVLQLRSSERKHSVVLRGASEELRFLLLMTRLDDRFVIE
jgi:anti-anti-sigma regulatory factor